MKSAPKRAAQAKTEFPKIIPAKGVPGITATIYRQERKKTDKAGVEQTYVAYLVSYSKGGRRHMESHADLAEAEAAARSAVNEIANGRQSVLELVGPDKEDYERFQEIIARFGVRMVVVAQVYANFQDILQGRATPEEVSRFYMRHNAKELPRISVPDAVKKCLAQATADGKSPARTKQLDWGLNALAEETNMQVANLLPAGLADTSPSMAAGERTKKNARDVIGYFGRWLVLHGYLARGTNLVEGVQRYSMKPGEIHIFSPREVSLLLEHASAKLLPYVAIGAFAGLRGAEIQRLDWSEVELLHPKPDAKQQDFGWIEVKAEKSKTDVRRLVPIKPNLAAWLKDHKKKDGPVCPFKNVVNELMDLVAIINKALPKGTTEKEKMVWKKNGLRHSYISYRVAECADVARVADESGNSPAIIKANYLRRVKPDAAAEWFAIRPSPKRSKKIVSLAAVTRRKAKTVQPLQPEPAVATA